MPKVEQKNLFPLSWHGERAYSKSKAPTEIGHQTIYSHPKCNCYPHSFSFIFLSIAVYCECSLYFSFLTFTDLLLIWNIICPVPNVRHLIEKFLPEKSVILH